MARLGAVLTDPTLDPLIQALRPQQQPQVIAPDQNRVEEPRRDDLFTVVAEQFVTDTARFADLVLPVTTQIEQLDLAPAWGHLNLALNRPAIAPRGEARTNNDIFRSLATEMGLDDPSLHESDEMLVKALLERDHPLLDGVTWEHLEAHGWCRFSLPHRHRPHDNTTPLGAPTQPDRATGPFQLISLKQHIKFLNANYAQFADHRPRTGEPHLEMHPDDADRTSTTATPCAFTTAAAS